jgi:hypothetical protein
MKINQNKKLNERMKMRIKIREMIFFIETWTKHIARW